MRGLVIYESEFGATRAVAEEIARGIRDVGRDDAVALDSRSWSPDRSWADEVSLLVIGVPTHAWGLPTPASRQDALKRPLRPGSTLSLEPRAADPGVREWLASTDLRLIPTAAFATRMALPRIITGSAARPLARLIDRAGGSLISPPSDFLVGRDGRVTVGQLDRAYLWGRELAAATASSALLT